MQIMLLAPQTAAATKVEFNTHGMVSCVITANGLATTERVDLFRNVNGTWQVVVNASGTAVELAPIGTGNGPSYELPGGAVYAFDKDATAAATSVDLTFITNNP